MYHPFYYGIYERIVNVYNYIVTQLSLPPLTLSLVSQQPYIYIISFVTSFSAGTVHGYTALFRMLQIYLIDEKEKYRSFKVVIYEKCQKGILDLIYHFIDLEKIIILNSDTIYKFKSLTIIPNDIHEFFPNTEISKNITNLINISIIYNLSTKIQVIPSGTFDRVSLIKTSKASSITNLGVIPHDDNYESFINSHKLKEIEPGVTHDELDVIRLIHNAKYIVFSWGTAFQKNFVYISERCKLIYVLIPQDTIFLSQYHMTAKKYLSHKSANVVFILINDNNPIQNIYLSVEQ